MAYNGEKIHGKGEEFEGEVNVEGFCVGLKEGGMEVTVDLFKLV